VGPAEVRPCWTATLVDPPADMATGPTAPTTESDPGAPVDRMTAGNAAGRTARAFVPVDELASAGAREEPASAPAAARERLDPAQGDVRSRRDAAVATRVTAEPRWSLWGDVEG
jgi:hypothetical protein